MEAPKWIVSTGMHDALLIFAPLYQKQKLNKQ